MERRDTEEIEAIKILHGLWTSENAILNAKLTQFVSGMAMLAVAFVAVAREGWPKPGVCVLGIGISFLWFLSLRRTQAYRKHWRNVIDDRVRANPDSPFAFWPTNSAWPIWDRGPSWLPVVVGPGAAVIVWIVLLWKAI